MDNKNKRLNKEELKKVKGGIIFPVGVNNAAEGTALANAFVLSGGQSPSIGYVRNLLLR